MILYHNPRCSSSREVLEILRKNKTPLVIREYLQDPPLKAELKSLIAKLGCKPVDLVRTKEPLFIESFKGKVFSDAEWLTILAKHPVLIQRPIIIDGDKAIIGRPVETVINFVKKKRGKTKKTIL